MNNQATTQEPKCADIVNDRCVSRLNDLEKLYKLALDDCEAYDDELGRLDEYGLCFDYVEPGTFEGQHEGYYRYQLAFGGPSQEIRYYVSRDEDGHLWHTPYRIEFWHMDWSDGACVDITENDTACNVYTYFNCF